MFSSTYHVEATWDPDAEIWVATSGDVSGLATEADSLEDLTRKLRVMIPELLEANQSYQGDSADEIFFEVTSRRRESVRIAC